MLLFPLSLPLGTILLSRQWELTQNTSLTNPFVVNNELCVLPKGPMSFHFRKQKWKQANTPVCKYSKIQIFYFMIWCLNTVINGEWKLFHALYIYFLYFGLFLIGFSHISIYSCVCVHVVCLWLCTQMYMKVVCMWVYA